MVTTASVKSAFGAVTVAWKTLKNPSTSDTIKCVTEKPNLACAASSDHDVFSTGLNDNNNVAKATAVITDNFFILIYFLIV